MGKDRAPITELNDRAKYLLKVLVEAYIQDGQPIGSTLLARKSGLQLSSATIRNVMARLEEMGLIRSPHTSAGRIPTSTGYRLFVDSLVNVRPLDGQTLMALEGTLGASQNPDSLIQSASSLLSGMTQLAGIVRLPRQEAIAIRHLEFAKLSAHQVLVILVMQNGDIQNRLLNPEHEYSTTELQQAANYLNEKLTGQTLQQARDLILEDMKQVRADATDMMQSAIDLGKQTFSDDTAETQDDCVIAGKTNLIAYDDLADMEKLRELFQAFNEKKAMLGLLDNALNADGVQIFIGRESGYEVFDGYSVVTASYHGDDASSVGVLGVIGPKRMAYERVIPVVDITARLLTASLKKQ